MTEFLRTLRQEVKRCLTEGRVIKRPPPVFSTLEQNVLTCCRAGFDPGGGVRALIGCTDPELYATLDSKPASIRWARYNLVSMGVLIDSGIRRAAGKGKKLPAWVPVRREP